MKDIKNIKDVQNKKMLKDVAKTFKLRQKDLKVIQPSTNPVVISDTDYYKGTKYIKDEFDVNHFEVSARKHKYSKFIKDLQTLGKEFDIDLDFIVSKVQQFKNLKSDPNLTYEEHMEILSKISSSSDVINDMTIKGEFIKTPKIEGKLFHQDMLDNTQTRKKISDFYTQYQKDIDAVLGEDSLFTFWPDSLDTNIIEKDGKYILVNHKCLFNKINISKLNKALIAPDDYYLIKPLFGIEIDKRLVQVLNDSFLFEVPIHIAYTSKDEITSIFEIF